MSGMMLWLGSILNTIWFALKILILTSIWVSVEHNYEFYLIRTLCRVSGTTSRFGCVMIRYFIYYWTYGTCLLIVFLAYSLIGHIRLDETFVQLFLTVEMFSLENNVDEKKVEWMFLIIISRHLVRLRIVSLQRSGVYTFQFAKRLSLIGFMLEGYLCGFWRIVFSACLSVDFLELLKLICRMCRAINDVCDYNYKTFFKTCLICLGLWWAYHFLCLLPTRFIYNLFYFENHEKTGVIPLFLFRVNFLAFLVLSAIDFPFGFSYPYIHLDTVDEIVNLGERPPNGPVVIPLLNGFEYLERAVRKRVPNTRATNIQTDRKTSEREVSQRAAIGQIIRCIVTLKKKARRIQAKREKVTHQITEEIRYIEKKD